MILEMEEDPDSEDDKLPIIFGRPFLATAGTN